MDNVIDTDNTILDNSANLDFTSSSTVENIYTVNYTDYGDMNVAESKDSNNNPYVMYYSTNYNTDTNNTNNTNNVIDKTKNHIDKNADNYIPINVSETISINYIHYEIFEVNLVPFNSCLITIILSSDTDQKRIIKLFMNSEEYANWNDNDQYLIDWINMKLTTTNVF